MSTPPDQLSVTPAIADLPGTQSMSGVPAVPPTDTVTLPPMPTVTPADLTALEQRLQASIDAVLKHQPAIQPLIHEAMDALTPTLNVAVSDAVDNRISTMETHLQTAIDALPGQAQTGVAAALHTLADQHQETVAALGTLADNHVQTQQAVAAVAPTTAAAVTASIQRDVLAQLERSPQASTNMWLSVWALGLIVTVAVGYLLVEAVSLDNATAKAWLPWVIGGLLTLSGLGGAFMAKSPLQK